MPESNQGLIPATIDPAMLAQLAEVKGQLAMIAQMIQTNHSATHQRIDDLRQAMDGRFEGLETRLGRLEDNERSTALRTAAVGAVSGAMVTGLLQLLKFKG